MPDSYQILAVPASLTNANGRSVVQLSPEISVTVGRAEHCNIRLPDKAVSRVHAVLFFDGKAWSVMDCSSSNGTRVNNKPVTRHLLQSGDVIRFANLSDWTFATESMSGSVPKVIRRLPPRVDSESFRVLTRIPTSNWSLLGESDIASQLRVIVRTNADLNASILIRGAFGTGKHHVARAIHVSSERRKQPCLFVDCRTVSADQLSEVLTTGKLLGLDHDQIPGTIVFDGITELNASAQVRLEQITRDIVAQSRQGTFGDTPPRFVSILSPESDLKTLSPELSIRLGVVQIQLEPLHERKEDIPELARAFAHEFAEEFHKTTPQLTQRLLNELVSYEWPANILELRNVIQRTVLLSQNLEIDSFSLRWGITETNEGDTQFAGLSLRDLEQRHIEKTLNIYGWKKTKVAEVLGIQRSTLHRKIETYRLTKSVDDTTSTAEKE